MSERGGLFLFSLAVILASLIVAAWLIATGQAAYIDGLFLLICCLVFATVFGFYARYLIRSVLDASASPAVTKQALAARESPAPVPVSAAERTAAKVN